ncbi:tRNA (guanine-N(7)-)-methyltransferase non-catalytic subunit wdr4 [Salarias fasciatus]|uniref:Uncharacterized protein n=1 Tax=Salarias fasciatus TaxID=181472 RepID=A0A672I5D2_SALFA|nr:tRNA (guanine-N(7)-)-methyltransferase non-catalytic subunit WDR4 [Salarias fasciatus]
MVAVESCGQWMVFSCDQKLVAVHRTEKREAFVFDCSTAEKRTKSTEDEKLSDGSTQDDSGSDRILALAVSGSGKLLAVTDDSKRLVLFGSEPSWSCISTRWVARRCTALVFSQTEEELLVADKSGDVYSFSVTEPQREGELKMGHLSMLLAVTVSPDNRYIITADRDEKIRVSQLRSPHNIQSFCLGHQQFVSALHINSQHPLWLLSGSGDGTLKLWELERGRRLQSRDLRKAETETESSESQTVSRISSSPDGRHVAVQCERVSTLEVFTLQEEGEEKLVPHSSLRLPHCPLDMTFDLEGRLWVLMDSGDEPLRLYAYEQSSWECDAEDPELNRVTEAFRPHWETLEASVRTHNRFEQLQKSSYDNVSAYLQKKQQRLEEQQLKRTKAQRPNGNKRAKKEASA